MRRLEHLVIDKRILAMLIQRTILLKMNRVGLFTRKFYSEDLKNIFIVIKAQDNLLRQVASVKISIIFSSATRIFTAVGAGAYRHLLNPAGGRAVKTLQQEIQDFQGVQRHEEEGEGDTWRGR